MDANERQRIIDGEHLDLLGLFHYITGGLCVAFSGIFVFQYTVMRFIFSLPEFQQQMAAEAAHAEAFFGFFMALLGFLLVVSIAYGVLLIVSGRFLRARRHRLFSFLVAIPILIMIPWGTMLGVFTMVVLERASVRALYRETQT